LTSEEMQQMIDSWEPEPLIPKKTPLMILNEKVPIISGTTTTHVSVVGFNKPVLNLARPNFLGHLSNPAVEEASRKAVYTYGTGTCGPRQFYGTIDVHLELEKRIATFLKAEDCLIYSYGFATISSAIPAFAGRGDLLIVDKGVSFAIQVGVNLSRSDVMWFNHNDMEDLEKSLKEVQKKDIQTKRTATRRFIVVEGLYYNYGDIAPLQKIMELKEKYKYRLIMEDSGIGVIGSTGRGTCEYYGIDVKKVDILTGNFETITSSVGGFCVGSKRVVYHQRLNSSGYVYSASLPPLLATASTAAFDVMDNNPSLFQTLARNTQYMYKGLKSITGISVECTSETPVIHVRLSQPYEDRYQNELSLQNVVDECLSNGVLLTRCKYVNADEKFCPPPSIRICVSTAHSTEQLSSALEVIRNAVNRTCSLSSPTSPSKQRSKKY